MHLVVNHAFAEELGYRSSDSAREVLSAVLLAIGRTMELFGAVPRVHPLAWSVDVGGSVTLHQWAARVAGAPDLHDVAEQLLRYLTVGPFLEPDAADLVPPETITPPLPASAYADLVRIGLGEVLYGDGAILLSVGAEASGVAAPEYQADGASLPNLRTAGEVETQGTARLAAEAADFAAVLDQLARVAPRVRLAGSVRNDIARGRSVLRPAKLRELVVALDTAAAAHAASSDWVAGFSSMSSAEIRNESDTVMNSPSLRSQRRFRLDDGRTQLCTWHVTITKGDRAYVWVEATPNGSVAHLAYVGKHLPTKNY